MSTGTIHHASDGDQEGRSALASAATCPLINPPNSLDGFLPMLNRIQTGDCGVERAREARLGKKCGQPMYID